MYVFTYTNCLTCHPVLIKEMQLQTWLGALSGAHHAGPVQVRAVSVAPIMHSGTVSGRNQDDLDAHPRG